MGQTTHKVKLGDTTWDIANQYGTTVNEIASVNGLSNPSLIFPGMELKIPGATSAGNNGTGGATEYKGYTQFDPGDYNKSQGVIDAENKAKDAAGAVDLHPDFTYDKQDDYNTLWSDYHNRKDFSYDFNADALYQQYKDKYIKQGKMAMADTIGQASAMTGGYGNSYAQTVGNQAYQASLENLNDVIPQLYQMAYDRYNQKGQDMLNRLGLYEKDRAYKYGIDQDTLDRLIADRGYYQGIADNMADDEYGRWLDDVGIRQTEHTNEENRAYDIHRDGIEDEQWEKNYGLSARELAMKEEAWELEKNAYSDPGNDTTDKPIKITTKNDKPETVTPTETSNTTKFINSHMSSAEFMQRGMGTSKTPSFANNGTGGRSYAQFKEYISAEIEKSWGELTDAERAYLIKYYKL